LYISQGAEQKVYLKDGATVLKLNDAIYYASWVDYFHNLLKFYIHCTLPELDWLLDTDWPACLANLFLYV
jgi:hypothetical protein